MTKEKPESKPNLLLQIHDMTLRLEEAQEALSAIRNGRVDALMVKVGEDERVYTLKGAHYIYHILFEMLNEGALTLSADSTILSANARFAHFVGVPLQRVRGASFGDFVAPEDRPRFATLLEEGAQRRSKGELILQGADGSRVPVMVSMNCINAEAVRSCTAVVTDLTDLKQAQEALQKAHDELEARVKARTEELAQANEALRVEIAERRRAEELLAEANQRKDEFLAMLAHEMRNPLAAVVSAVQILHLQGAEDPMLRYAQEAAERQAQNIVRMLDDLLDVARITRGKIELRKESVDLAAIVDYAIQAISPFIQERGHELSISLPAEPVRLEADPTRLEQILCNLLNNAAKYTPRGRHIWLTAQREGDEAVLRVRDDGVGIPHELLSHVFDLFMQADRSLDRSQGGLGIGLTLVRSLVEMHGGSVEAHSDGLGKGSELVVRLPALAAAPEGQLAKAPSGGGEAEVPCSRRVLLVDDNKDAARLISLLMEMDGHEVRVVHDGPSALATVVEYQPEVILLDIGLPGMDGHEVARQLRQKEGLPRPVLIALTGYGQEQDRQRAWEAGFDHHLVKPVDLGELKRMVTTARARAEGELSATL